MGIPVPLDAKNDIQEESLSWEGILCEIILILSQFDERLFLIFFKLWHILNIKTILVRYEGSELRGVYHMLLNNVH